MKFKIIEFYLKENNSIEIARLLDLSIEFVKDTILEYLDEPYYIRQSKMNYELI